MVILAMAPSSSSAVRERVEITSPALFALLREAKIEAKASSVIDLGRLCVTEIGRWREKKVDRPRAS